MRLMIVAKMNDKIIQATKMAQAKGARVYHVDDHISALNALRSGRGADLIMVEVSLDIKALITGLNSEKICVPVIACGIEVNKELAVKAIKAGAKEYVTLPPNEEIISAIFESIVALGKQHEIVYNSECFKEIIKVADQVAASDATVLITGESGTGKEGIAKYIFSKSKRSSKEFICLNCAAIPDNLLESELFGHEKGAFTGAVEKRIGKFEEANGGTILLDEISEMDLRLQAKLLRAIQEREIYRVGGNTPIKLNIRIIATSNRNLIEEVKAQKFREDLFFRLSVINIKLPSLSERKDDIKLLAEHFIKKYSALNDVQEKPLSLEALKKLENYPWPGNVRELENSMHRAVLLSSTNRILPEDIMLTYDSVAANDDQPEIKSLVEVEKETIEKTLKFYNGNYDQTANVLGITLKVLKNKLKEYKLVS